LNISIIASQLNLKVIGDKNAKIYSVSSHDNPKPESVVLITKKKFLTKTLVDSNAVIMTYPEFQELLLGNNLILSSNPQLSFAKLTKLLNNNQRLDYTYFNSSNSSYVHGRNLNLGKNTQVGFNVVFEENVSIGEDCVIGHNVVIHKNVSIGNNVFIDSGTIIGSEGFGNVLSEDFEWSHVFHVGKVIIGNNVMIGANCSIDRGTIDDTVIEDGAIIDNQVHIAHNVLIGEDTAIAANVGIAGSCKIGKRNMIGGMVGIADHISTADDVIVSATSTVSKDLKESGVFTGIMPISKHSNWKRIALWITKLEKIAKFLNLKKI